MTSERARRARGAKSVKGHRPTDRIPGRVRTRPQGTLAPPNVIVLALPLSACDRHPHGVAGVVRETISAIPPGWSHSIDEAAGSDAVACARHQATLRGDDLLVIEPPAPTTFPVVALRRAGACSALMLTLVVVRFSRWA